MTNQTPKKIDIMRDKLIAIECRSHKTEDLAYTARHLNVNKMDEIKRNVRLIMAICNELWTIVCTDEEKGKDWGWWE